MSKKKSYLTTGRVGILLAFSSVAFALLNNNDFMLFSFVLFLGLGIALAFRSAYIKYILCISIVLIGAGTLSLYSNYYLDIISQQAYEILESTMLLILFAVFALFGGVKVSKGSTLYAISLFIIAIFPLVAYGLGIDPFLYIDQNMGVFGYYLLVSVGVAAITTMVLTN